MPESLLRVALGELEHAGPAADRVLGARRVGVAGLVEEELAEAAAGPEDAVLRALERRALAARRERQLAMNGAFPSVRVSWIVTHLVLNALP